MAPTTAVQDNNSAGVSSSAGGGGKNDTTQDGASNPKQSAKQTEKINASLASELCLPDTSPPTVEGTNPPSSGSTKKRGRPKKTTQSTEESTTKKKRSSIEKATEEYWKEAKERGTLKEPVYQSTNMTTTATTQVAKADDNLLPPVLKKNKVSRS